MWKKIRDAEDRISQLPDVIVHHILSFLESPVDLVRLGVLSNKWFALTASFPNFDFDIYKIKRILGQSQELEQEKYYKYVDNRISRFCKENMSAYSFKLVTTVEEPTQVDIVDRWIGLIVEKNVQVLELSVYTFLSLENDWIMPQYRLPNTLLSATCLTSLTINECKLPSSLMVDGVKFKLLKKLSLFYVQIDVETLKYLTSSCPLLEEIRVSLCNGLTRFCVKGLQNLQNVKISYMTGFEGFDIEAPNLQSIYLQDFDKTRVPSSVNVASCKKLTTLSFDMFDSPPLKGFALLISNLPFIQDLTLRMMTKHHHKLKFSSHSLRKFVLFGWSDLKDIKINAPNLFLFKYYNGVMIMPLTSRMFSSLESRKCMEYYCRDSVDSYSFKRLRRFLDQHKFKVLKWYIKEASMCSENLKAIQSPAFELEHVELEFDDSKNFLVYVDVVDAVFWCCRPRSITLGLRSMNFGYPQLNDILKHTHETLLQQEDEGPTNIHIEMSSASKTKKHFKNLNSLMTVLPCYLPVQVTFRKEKGGRHVDGGNGNSWNFRNTISFFKSYMDVFWGVLGA